MKTFTRAEFLADPDRVLSATDDGDVEVVDEDGERRLLMRRGSEDSDA